VAASKPCTYAFAVGKYDAEHALVIDPGLVYSTYVGGSQVDSGTGIALDAAGNAYITGWTASTIDFPTTGGSRYECSDEDPLRADNTPSTAEDRADARDGLHTDPREPDATGELAFAGDPSPTVAGQLGSDQPISQAIGREAREQDFNSRVPPDRVPRARPPGGERVSDHPRHGVARSGGCAHRFGGGLSGGNR
jgi:hypothetical protein